MTTVANAPVLPRSWTIAYWIATAYVAVTSAAAGIADVLRLEPVLEVVLHLGYPAYFATILGVWKVLGAIALVASRHPRLKEWAYAGFFIDFTAAIASFVAVDDPLTSLVGPSVSLVFLVASWALRPASRRLDVPPQSRS